MTIIDNIHDLIKYSMHRKQGISARRKHKSTRNNSFWREGIHRNVGLHEQGQCVYMYAGASLPAFVFACVAVNWRSIHTWVNCKKAYQYNMFQG